MKNVAELLSRGAFVVAILSAIGVTTCVLVMLRRGPRSEPAVTQISTRDAQPGQILCVNTTGAFRWDWPTDEGVCPRDQMADPFGTFWKDDAGHGNINVYPRCPAKAEVDDGRLHVRIPEGTTRAEIHSGLTKELLACCVPDSDGDLWCERECEGGK